MLGWAKTDTLLTDTPLTVIASLYAPAILCLFKYHYHTISSHIVYTVDAQFVVPFNL